MACQMWVRVVQAKLVNWSFFPKRVWTRTFVRQLAKNQSGALAGKKERRRLEILWQRNMPSNLIVMYWVLMFIRARMTLTGRRIVRATRKFVCRLAVQQTLDSVASCRVVNTSWYIEEEEAIYCGSRAWVRVAIYMYLCNLIHGYKCFWSCWTLLCCSIHGWLPVEHDDELVTDTACAGV